MATPKMYKYKVWVEVERVEVNNAGEEIGKNHQRGEYFGADPDKVADTDSMQTALDLQTALVKFGSGFASVKK